MKLNHALLILSLSIMAVSCSTTDATAAKDNTAATTASTPTVVDTETVDTQAAAETSDATQEAATAAAATNVDTGPAVDMSKATYANMDKMHAVMQSIQQEKSPEKRQALLAEHMDLMQANMKAMGDMKKMDMMNHDNMIAAMHEQTESGDEAMAAGMMLDMQHDMKMDAANTCSGELMQQCADMMKMTFERINMMQMMLEQTILHQQAMSQTSKK